MSEDPKTPPPDRLALLEQRLARLEQHLGLPPADSAISALPAASLQPAEATSSPPPASDPSPLASGHSPPTSAATEPPPEDLEFVVGQNWFAIVGIVIFTCGVAFALSLPLPGLPAAAPSLIGVAIAGGFLLAAQLGRASFELVAGYFRGAGVALLFFAVLRLYYFGDVHALAADSHVGAALLVAAVGLNVALALRQRSQPLLGLALLTGAVAALAVGAPLFVFASITLLALLAAAASLWQAWPALVLLAVPATYLTHLLWAINRPWQDRPLQFVDPSRLSLGFLLLYVLILGASPLWRRDRKTEGPFTILTALGNCALGYGLFLLHTAAVNPLNPVAAHLAASLVFLGLAVAFHRRDAGRTSVFFYAMTGYMALSVAIARKFGMPEVFLWLSLQSLVVVATALWFRSRFIVVANFFIFLAIVLGYMVLNDGGERGVCFGFGFVALVTARVLNWKKERLELKTGFMRNAYLASAFVVIPYALYHVVPHAYVGVSWVGVALMYYVLNLIVRNPRYRWMGHLTLLGTVLYLLIIGITQLTAAYRILSFLLLGGVLLAISLLFTQLRRRARRTESAGPSHNP